jgi:hypothetical protein
MDQAGLLWFTNHWNVASASNNDVGWRTWNWQAALGQFNIKGDLLSADIKVRVDTAVSLEPTGSVKQ